MFEDIVKDPEIRAIYKEIREYEDREEAWAYHGENHVKNVANIVKQVLEALKVEDEIIEDSMVAVALHDLGCIKGKENHEIRSYEMAREYLEKKNIKVHDKERILKAIKNHRNGFETNDIMTLVLIFSDKLDIKKERVAKTGYLIEGMRQMQYIEDIKIDIEDDKLIIKFIMNEKINLEELKQFYFIPKVRKAINSFAKAIDLEPIIYGI